MTVLRELVARLGFQIDGQSVKRAEGAVERVKSSLGKLGQVAGLAGLGAGLQKIVTLASDANETSNVLGEVFGPAGAQQVKDWAAAVGQEVGRSQYQLREFTGTLGAMLQPMVGSSAAAQQMSTTLAKLAVDLGSFFNTTDDDALIALRAGIAGETEPLRRFGVVMLDATLQEYARAKGIRKSISAMTVAEKTQLRYGFILEHTTKAQGDAARTAGGYANSMKALKAAVRDIATDMGTTLIPKVERLVKSARDGLRSFQEWARGTKALEATMLVLAGAAVAIGASMLAPFVVPAIAVAALILLVDELLTLFSGGKTVIGEFVDSVFGIGAADEFVRSFAAGVEVLAQAWRDLFSDTSTGEESLGKYVSVLEQIEMAGANAYDAIVRLWNALRDAAGSIPGLGALLGARDLTSSDRTSARGVNAPLMTGQQSAAQNLRERNEAGRRQREQGVYVNRATERGVNGGVEHIGFGQAGPSAVAAVASAVSSPEPSKQVNVQTGATNVTINAPGGNPEAIRRAVQEALAAERRRTGAAVARAGGT